MQSLSSNLSKIPSHPKITKSCLFVILNWQISGSATTTSEFPSKCAALASMSPKVRQTLNRPGNTLCGPKMT